MTFLNFKYTNQTLSNLTFATCLFGGLLWTTKYYNIKRKQITNAKSYGMNIFSQDLDKLNFYDNYSIKSLLSIFYWYSATYVNLFLLECTPLNIETLTTGYVVVLSSIVIDGVTSLFIYVKDNYKYFYTYVDNDDK